MIIDSKTTLPRHSLIHTIKLNSNKKYGPGDMTNGNQFIISKQEWATIGAYIQTGLGLPVNEQQLRTHVNLSQDISIPNDFSQLYDVYCSDKTSAEWWNKNLYPLIIKSANDIASYGFKVAGDPSIKKDGYFKKLQDELDNIVDNNSDDDAIAKAIKDFKARCGILIKEAKKYEEAAKNIVTSLDQFLHGDQKKLEGVINIQKRLKEVQTALNQAHGESSPAHKELLEKVKNLKTTLERTIKAEQDLEKKVEYSFLLGPLLGFVVYEILENTAVQHIKNQIDEIKKQLDSAQHDLDRDVKIIGMLNSINTDIDNLYSQGQEAIKVFQKLQGIWATIGAQIENLRTTSLQEVQDSDDADEIQIELEDASDAWLVVAQEARDFTLNAYSTNSRQNLPINVISDSCNCSTTNMTSNQYSNPTTNMTSNQYMISHEYTSLPNNFMLSRNSNLEYKCPENNFMIYWYNNSDWYNN
ncbi:alpha-xenorhabdolysin family binary toxin subunit A [Bacillus thuringiensis]|uniref:alpha-xenorhabdolysin family binary toxin subunit A n=1 Tax=Bacillus thuringiensis TaxID=1428 RepID=UPI00300E036D